MEVDLARLPGPTAGDLAAVLPHLQGNILKGHNREHVTLLTFRFGDQHDPLAVRTWLADFTTALVTPATLQREQSARFRAGGDAGPFGSILLSAEGYRQALDVALYAGQFDLDLPGDVEVSFGAGMKAAELVLGDADVPEESRLDDWCPPYHQDMHGLVLLADNDPERLTTRANDAAARIGGIGVELAREQGRRLWRGNQAIEPFGFADGISQPRFDAVSADAPASDDSAPLELILRPDPLTKVENACGSFLAFLKLEQDVAAFQRATQAVADKVGIHNELAAALIVGRFPDGSPLALEGRAAANPTNKFAFLHAGEEDREGRLCPQFAHIRKANPRGWSGDQHERHRRIARRGIPYDDGNGRRGLLFMAYQGDIARQFGTMQKSWLNAENFLFKGTGTDPIGGRGGADRERMWPAGWKLPPSKPCPLPPLVTVRGGEFLFAPSLPFLRGEG